MPSAGFAANVQSILLSGGLGLAESLLGLGWSRPKVYFYLQAKFTPIGGSPYAGDVYSAVVSRAESALASGAALRRKQSNVPLEIGQYTEMPGLSTEFQYSAVVGFVDASTGQGFTRLFRVGGNMPLGKFDVLSLVHQQALAFAGNVPDYSPFAQSGDIQLTGQMRITDALIRV